MHDLRPVRLAGAGVVRGDEHGDLDLDRIGVLELVQEQPLVALGERASHVETDSRVAKYVARQHEQVVELELPSQPTGLRRCPR